MFFVNECHCLLPPALDFVTGDAPGAHEAHLCGSFHEMFVAALIVHPQAARPGCGGDVGFCLETGIGSLKI
jgi:hypothetical protein